LAVPDRDHWRLFKLGNWRFLVLPRFWALLLAGIAVAFQNWREDPEQRSGRHLGVWLARTLIGCMWFQGMLWKLPLPVSILDRTAGGFSLVEHPMPPRKLAAPLHRHSRENEFSFVLEGRVGALLGDEVVYGEVGDLIFKPRGQWHTFWNAADTPPRILEIISPAGFECYFEELIELLPKDEPPDPNAIAALAAR
jgi:mannose-6-phosphate isomerase-like protein (cupin superfamily)